MGFYRSKLNPWIAPLALFLAALPAPAQQPSPPPIAVSNAWLAARYDSTRVQIILESFTGTPAPAMYAMLKPTETPAPFQPDRPEAPCEPFCFPPISLDGANAFDTYLRQHSSQAALPPLAKPGDAFLIQLGNGATVSATVSRMLGTWGTDGLFLGALATVAPGDLPAFQASSARAFVAVRAETALPSSLATLSHAASTAERQTITDLLQRHRKEYIAEARAGLRSTFTNFMNPPRVPAAQATRLGRLQHGAGTLHAEITPVKLGSGKSRYYVRAEWLVDGKATFAVGAWIALAPQPRVLWWDAADATRCFVGSEIALDAPDSGIRMFAELLNVATLADGRAGLVLLHWGYESFDLNLDVLVDAGPRNTSATSYGDGG